MTLAAIAVIIVAADFTVGPFLTTHYVQVARVDTSSMSPTLHNQDRLLVDKRLSSAGDPAPGDIVMLRYPLDPEKTFVKRVIALGGDEVHIVDGAVLRNGRRIDEPYVMTASRSRDDWGPQVVPGGTYFVLGDQRNNSSDSRHWGFVPREYILGRVNVRWWPLSAWRRF